MSKLIFGCGYLGKRVAKRWRDAGQTVYVVTRSDAKAREFEQAGLFPIVADVLRPESLAKLPVADSVLYSIGYDRAARGSRHVLYVDGLKAALDALPKATGTLLYVSSTGVYGQSHDEWVDELSPCEPLREAGQACLAAEQVLATHPLGRRAVVLRMAGLYGPERIPNGAAIRRGEPIGVAEHGYLNLIHVDDAADVVLAAERHAQPPRTYVVSDGHPVERRAYYEELARLLEAPRPRFLAPTAESSASARAESSKRIKNARLIEELRVRPGYPSFREGLAAIVAAEGSAHRLE
ncbi:MAG: SDR family oxidoreductase [Pirellulales bacterium]